MVSGLVIAAYMLYGLSLMLYGLSFCGWWISERCQHVVWTEFMWLVD